MSRAVEQEFDPLTLQKRLIAIEGIYDAAFTPLDTVPGIDRIIWLTGPGSLSLAQNPPEWLSGAGLPIVVTGIPDETALQTLPVWTGNETALAMVRLSGRRCRLDDWLPAAMLEIGRARDTTASTPSDKPRQSGPASSAGPAATIGVALSEQPALLEGTPLIWPDAFPRTFVDAILRCATSPRGATIYRPDGSISRPDYESLVRRALSTLAGLQRHGLKQGDIVIIASNDAESLIVGLWASLLGGLLPTALEIPEGDTLDGAAQRLLASASLLGHPPWLLDSRSAARAQAVPMLAGQRVFDIETLSQGDASAAIVATVTPDDPALLILTSGSTGVPKGVVQTHRALLTMQAAVLHMHMQAGPDDVLLNWLPRDHVGALSFVILGATALQASQVHADTAPTLARPQRWLDIVGNERVSITWSPNFAYELLARAARDTEAPVRLDSLRFVVNGGEAVTESSLIQGLGELQRRGLRGLQVMVPSFGMSETCAPITFGRLGNARGPFTSMGPVVPGSRLRIVDEQGQLLREGEIGRIQVCSEQLLQRYHGLPDDMARVDGSPWFDTGDSGFVAGGELYVTGRIKDTLNVRGVTIFAQEIEDSLTRIPGIDPTCVVALSVRSPDARTEDIAIFFSTFPHDGIDHPEVVDAVASAIREQLRTVHGMTPKHLVALGTQEFPRTAIGKVVRRELRKRLEAGEYRAKRIGSPGADDVITVALHRPVWPAVASVDDALQSLRFEPVQVGPANLPDCRGLWVVVGGLGGLGRHCCRLLQALGASLLILGQTDAADLPDDKRTQLALLAAGGVVRYALAPSGGDWRALIDATEHETGSLLAGAIHAAGTDLASDEAPDSEACQRGERATLGTLDALAALQARQPAMHLLVTASIVGLIGGRLKNYVAQQAALIDRARSLQEAGRAVTLIAFSSWLDTGLSRDRTHASLLARDGLHALSPRAGCAVLAWALAHPGCTLCAGLDDRHPLHAWRVDQPPTVLLAPASRRDDAHDGGAIRLADARGAMQWVPLLGQRAASHSQDDTLDGRTAGNDDPVAASIAHFMGELLERESVGHRDDFFELGGDSVLATRLASMLGEWFFTEVPVGAIFQSPSAAELAERLRRGEARPGLVETVAAHLAAVLAGAESAAEDRPPA